MLVLDRSGSIEESGALQQVKQTAIDFLSQLDWSRDEAGLVTYNSTATRDVGLGSDVQELEDSINAMTSEGGTNIAAGVALATVELQSTPVATHSQRVIVLLTDGQAKGDELQARAAAAYAHTVGIRLITIGLGATNAALLEQIASSPTDYHHAPTSDDLAAIYRAIVQELSCVESTP